MSDATALAPRAPDEKSPRERDASIGAVRQFSRHALLLVLALALLNGSNYVFHIAVSRLLGPADYGALAALLAVLMVLSVPLGVVQTVLAKRAAVLCAGGETGGLAALAVGASRWLLSVGGIAALCVLAATPLLGAFLDAGTLETALLAPFTLLALLASVPLGMLQGGMRFGALVAVTVFGVVVRLCAGIGLVWAGFGIAGAIGALVIAQAASLGLGLVLLRIPRAVWSRRGVARPFRGELTPTLLALGSFWLLAELDIVLARHYLEPEAAGFYSSAGLVGRGLLFLVAAVSIAALPRFAASFEPGGDPLRWLRLGLGAVVALTLVGMLGLVLLKDLLITVAFGEAYRPAVELVPIVAAGVAFLSVANLLVFFHVAAGTRAYVFVFAAAAAEIALVSMEHDSGREIALAAVAANLLATSLLAHAAFASARWRTPLSTGISTPGLEEEPTVDLTVVLPCHNAGEQLGGVLDAIGSNFADRSHELIVVSDGSTDDTVAVARASTGGVRVFHYDDRVGKGHALRLGLEEARGRYVAFIDADGDVDPASLRPFVDLMRLYSPDIVLGSKRHPMSTVSYPPLRRILSWGYHKLARVLFRIDVRDTQTGLKLIRRDVLAAVLPRMLEKRYAFDLELLVVARNLGYRRVFEAPVRIEYQFSSRINVRATFRILVDTFAIFYRQYVLRTYRAERQVPAIDRTVLPPVTVPAAAQPPVV